MTMRFTDRRSVFFVIFKRTFKRNGPNKVLDKIFAALVVYGSNFIFFDFLKNDFILEVCRILEIRKKR